MVKCRIVMADEDLQYLTPIEYSLMREFGDSIELNIFSNGEMLREHVERSGPADIFILHEDMLENARDYINPEKVLIISETAESISVDSNIFPYIYKYNSFQDISNTVKGTVARSVNKDSIGGIKRIVIYSPQGGSGKTTVALGLCGALANLGRKVIYVDAETIQDFGEMVETDSNADDELLREMRDCKIDSATLERNIHKGSFNVLRPLKYSLASCKLSESSYREVFRSIKRMEEYDYLVIDTSSSFDEEKAKLISQADFVILPILQNRVGKRKLEALKLSMEIGDDKFMVVINAYTSEKPNYLAGSESFNKAETIPVLSEEILQTAESLKRSGVYAGLAFKYI